MPRGSGGAPQGPLQWRITRTGCRSSISVAARGDALQTRPMGAMAAKLWDKSTCRGRLGVFCRAAVGNQTRSGQRGWLGIGRGVVLFIPDGEGVVCNVAIPARLITEIARDDVECTLDLRYEAPPSGSASARWKHVLFTISVPEQHDAAVAAVIEACDHSDPTPHAPFHADPYPHPPPPQHTPALAESPGSALGRGLSLSPDSRVGDAEGAAVGAEAVPPFPRLALPNVPRASPPRTPRAFAAAQAALNESARLSPRRSPRAGRGASPVPARVVPGDVRVCPSGFNMAMWLRSGRALGGAAGAEAVRDACKIAAQLVDFAGRGRGLAADLLDHMQFPDGCSPREMLRARAEQVHAALPRAAAAATTPLEALLRRCVSQEGADVDRLAGFPDAPPPVQDAVWASYTQRVSGLRNAPLLATLSDAACRAQEATRALALIDGAHPLARWCSALSYLLAKAQPLPVGTILFRPCLVSPDVAAALRTLSPGEAYVWAAPAACLRDAVLADDVLQRLRRAGGPEDVEVLFTVRGAVPAVPLEEQYPAGQGVLLPPLTTFRVGGVAEHAGCISVDLEATGTVVAGDAGMEGRLCTVLNHAVACDQDLREKAHGRAAEGAYPHGLADGIVCPPPPPHSPAQLSASRPAPQLPHDAPESEPQSGEVEESLPSCVIPPCPAATPALRADANSDAATETDRALPVASDRSLTQGSGSWRATASDLVMDPVALPSGFAPSSVQGQPGQAPASVVSVLSVRTERATPVPSAPETQTVTQHLQAAEPTPPGSHLDSMVTVPSRHGTYERLATSTPLEAAAAAAPSASDQASAQEMHLTLRSLRDAPADDDAGVLVQEEEGMFPPHSTPAGQDLAPVDIQGRAPERQRSVTIDPVPSVCMGGEPSLTSASTRSAPAAAAQHDSNTAEASSKMPPMTLLAAPPASYDAPVILQHSSSRNTNTLSSVRHGSPSPVQSVITHLGAAPAQDTWQSGAGTAGQQLDHLSLASAGPSAPVDASLEQSRPCEQTVGQAAGQGTTGQQSISHRSMNEQRASEQSISHQPVNQSMSEPPVSQHSFSQQAVSQQSIGQQPVNQSMNQHATSQPSISHRSMNEQRASQQSISHQPVNQSMSEPPVSQHSFSQPVNQSISELPVSQSMSQQAVSQASISHQSMNEQRASQQSISQQPVNQSMSEPPVSQHSFSQQPSMSELPVNQSMSQQAVSQASISHRSMNEERASQQLMNEPLLNQSMSQHAPSLASISHRSIDEQQASFSQQPESHPSISQQSQKLTNQLSAPLQTHDQGAVLPPRTASVLSQVTEGTAADREVVNPSSHSSAPAPVAAEWLPATFGSQVAASMRTASSIATAGQMEAASIEAETLREAASIIRKQGERIAVLERKCRGLRETLLQTTDSERVAKLLDLNHEMSVRLAEYDSHVEDEAARRCAELRSLILMATPAGEMEHMSADELRRRLAACQRENRRLVAGIEARDEASLGSASARPAADELDLRGQLTFTEGENRRLQAELETRDADLVQQLRAGARIEAGLPPTPDVARDVVISKGAGEDAGLTMSSGDWRCVSAVAPGSPAAAAGVTTGSMVVAVNKKAVDADGADAFRQALQAASVVLTVSEPQLAPLPAAYVRHFLNALSGQKTVIAGGPLGVQLNTSPLLHDNQAALNHAWDTVQEGCESLRQLYLLRQTLATEHSEAPPPAVSTASSTHVLHA